MATALRKKIEPSAATVCDMYPVVKMTVMTRSQTKSKIQAQANTLHLQFQRQQQRQQQRPQRAAAVKALEKMHAILAYEAELEVHEPATMAETTLPPTLDYKTIMNTLHAPSYNSTCKAYMTEMEHNTPRKHLVLLEFLKYLASNPERLVGSLRWRKCVLDKMNAFNYEISIIPTIGGVHITDEYRRKVKALISAVRSIATLAPYLDFDSPSFEENSRKLARIAELCNV